MYQKEVNRRSPLRVFERSIHGGLGPGNIGLVMSRAGVGKTAFLIGVALDDLMRGRKVLHVNTEDTAEKVREFYDEVFHDLAEANELSDKNAVHLTVERNRMIHTFLGDTFSMERLQGALGYMREFMDFAPAAVILDGYPKWDTATDEQMEELKELAGKLKCELWLSSLIHRDGEEVDDRGIPQRIARLEKHISVMLRLRPTEDHVRLELVKDHENQDLADLHIELDPRSLLLAWR
ncbi:MAG: AAA family ATPase [Candidatus Eisenbacteria bacterium]|uniref:AAA family ATPase n=1 Tax=Eiseniibacteriota bacterium TaxID=2212470 RepID=A0A956LZK1_UNCEI|nr:AAA family ATPase [Candidatus Eisenbacteria bacterium]